MFFFKLIQAHNASSFLNYIIVNYFLKNSLWIFCAHKLGLFRKKMKTVYTTFNFSYFLLKYKILPLIFCYIGSSFRKNVIHFLVWYTGPFQMIHSNLRYIFDYILLIVYLIRNTKKTGNNRKSKTDNNSSNFCF